MNGYHIRPGTGLLPPAFLAIALALHAGCSRQSPPAPPPPVVEVFPAETKAVARSTVFIGQLDSPQNVEIRTRVESFVEKIHFEDGAEIEAGAPLFSLNTRQFEENLAVARGKLAEARAALKKSEDDVTRLLALAKANAVAQKDLDAGLRMREARTGEVAAAEATVASAERDLSYCDIRAPIAGRIGEKQVSIGSLVGKGEPTLLATISQVDPIWFYCSISEVDFLRADRIAKESGRTMADLPIHLILADGSEHPEQGRWAFVDRIVNPTTATIRARVEFPNPTKTLRPGMFGRIRISLPPKDGFLVVPERALTEIQGKAFLWVIGEGDKASQRAVEIADQRYGTDALVLSGLQPGERVVVEGIHKIHEGQQVQIAPKPVTPPQTESRTPATGNP